MYSKNIAADIHGLADKLPTAGELVVHAWTNVEFGNIIPGRGKIYNLDGYFGLFLTNKSGNL